MGTEIDGVNGIIKNTTSDGDITIKGNDGGSEISALVLDMSAAGAATFNNKIIATELDISGAIDVDGTTNLDVVDIDGAVDFASTTAHAGTASFADNAKVILGTGNDLQLYHDGSNSYVQDSGTGDLKIISDGNAISLQKGTTETMAFFDTDAGVELYHNNVAKFVTTAAGIDVTGTVTATGTSVFTNLDISGDVDVDGTTNLDVVDIDGAVNMATTALVTGVLTTTAATVFNGGFTSNDGSTITVADNSDNLTLTSTDTDASSGPNLRLYRNSHTGSHNPQDGDDLGKIEFEGQNDAGQDVVYGRIRTQLRDASDGTEDGKMDLGSILAGTEIDWLTFDPADTNGASVIFNQGSADIDFRVESAGNADMLNINSGTNRVGIAGPADLGIGLHIREADSGASVENYADALVLEGAGDSGMTICSGASSDGSINFADSGAADVARITYNHNSNHMHFNTNGAERLRISDGGKVGISEAAPDVSDGGLCINQGASDSNILTFKSSDVDHAITALAETDTYVEQRKLSDGSGGLLITAFSGSAVGMKMEAFITGSNTAESTSATSAWAVDARKKNNNNVHGLDADDNIASFRQSDEAQFIIKGDGELFSNQSATVGTFDTYEDAQLVRAFDLNHMQGVINSKFDKFVQYNKDDLQKARLIGTDDDGNATPMVNITGMSRLHNGAIWQQYEATQKLTNAMYELAKAAVGEDKANEILEQNEIKLLN